MTKVLKLLIVVTALGLAHHHFSNKMQEDIIPKINKIDGLMKVVLDDHHRYNK